MGDRGQGHPSKAQEELELPIFYLFCIRLRGFLWMKLIGSHDVTPLKKEEPMVPKLKPPFFIIDF